MNSGVLARLLLGLVLAFTFGCSKQDAEVEQDFSTLPPATLSKPTPTNEQAATTPVELSNANDGQTALPSASATADFSGWRVLGSEKTGLQLSIPADWVNLTGVIDTAVATNPLGLIVLLAADSEQTGTNLLGGKFIEDGAYAAGLISHLDLPPTTPQAALERLVTERGLQPANGAPVPVTILNATGGQIPGAYVDLLGSPLAFDPANAAALRSRLYLFTSPLSGAVGQQTQALLLFAAPAAVWDSYLHLFTQMAKNLIIHNIYNNYVLSGGAVNVVGNLGEQDMVNGRLEAGTKDVWTFRVDEPRYATISVTPEDAALDLTWTLYSPTGQTLVSVDNGYAGNAELLTDQLLTDTGLYVLEISDFFQVSGRYVLSLALAQEPLFGGGGEIKIQQTLESTLPPNGRQNWIFTGNAGDLITAVLTPQDPFDAILELYGPDGRQLVNLDEGYSGDAELFSGIELPQTGQYTLTVSSFAGNGGRYALSLDTGGDSTANFYDAGDLTYGETRSETFQPFEAHVWFFTGLAGDQITLTAAPLDEDLDLDIWLLDAEANRLTAQDTAQVGGTETLTYTLPQDGQYLIFVREFFGKTGPYQISLTKN